MAIKPGVKTSEFWAIVISGVVSAFGRALNLPDAVIQWINSLVLAYLGSRTILKSIGVHNGVK
jgi:hypothetical protein